MFNVFKGALLALVREKSVFIWSLAFPLILSLAVGIPFTTVFHPSS